jgi:hypothetical protein
LTKKRILIPKAIAAKVLFSSDRTCCVCRIAGKKIQIHHVDDDPSNNDPVNLSVLCLDCHADTQVKGGFGRQLDAEQVTLYRDDWYRIVATRRVQAYRDARDESMSEDSRIRYLTSLTEMLREKQDYVSLAGLYDDMENDELRDKYVALALEADSSDWLVIYLRALQNRRDLIPDDVAERRLGEQLEREDWAQRARTLVDLGRYVDAAHDYVKDILESLETGNAFSAAYYLKEIFESDLVQHLFEQALQKAADEGSLWWQVRALQELEWDSELKELLLANEEDIRSSDDAPLLALLLHAKGDEGAADKVMIEFNSALERDGDVVYYPSTEQDQEVSSGEDQPE